MRTFIIKIIVSVLLLVGVLQNAVAQSPNAFSFQAIVRNASGQLLTNTNVGVKITIYEGSYLDHLGVYSERHVVTSNENGLVTLEIGMGTDVTGSLSSVNWNGGNIWGNQHYLKVEVDPTGGTNYTVVSDLQRMLSVPSALHANTSGDNKWASNGSTIYNLNNGPVCIGTTSPLNSLTGLTLNKNVSGYYGMYVDAGTNGDPFYGYAINDVPQAWTYFDDASKNWYLYNGGISIASNQNTTNVAIGGTPTTTDKLYVNGKTNTADLQVRNGAGEGKVFTSDANGNASWERVPGYVNYSFYNDNTGVSVTTGQVVDIPGLVANFTLTKPTRVLFNFSAYLGSSPSTTYTLNSKYIALMQIVPNAGTVLIKSITVHIPTTSSTFNDGASGPIVLDLTPGTYSYKIVISNAWGGANLTATCFTGTLTWQFYPL